MKIGLDHPIVYFALGWVFVLGVWGIFWLLSKVGNNETE